MLLMTSGTHVLLQSMWGRRTLVCTDFVLSGQGRSYCVQPCERQLFRLAEIDTAELARTPVVGTPVPATALVASLLTASRELPTVAAKSEQGGRIQPGIPDRGSDNQCLLVPIPLIGQRPILYDSNDLSHALHPRRLDP
jgi:hypothetical protein